MCDEYYIGISLTEENYVNICDFLDNTIITEYKAKLISDVKCHKGVNHRKYIITQIIKKFDSSVNVGDIINTVVNNKCEQITYIGKNDYFNYSTIIVPYVDYEKALYCINNVLPIKIKYEYLCYSLLEDKTNHFYLTETQNPNCLYYNDNKIGFIQDMEFVELSCDTKNIYKEMSIYMAKELTNN